MSLARKKMDDWAKESALMTKSVEKNGNDPELLKFLKDNTEAWQHYARLLSRLERYVKSGVVIKSDNQ